MIERTGVISGYLLPHPPVLVPQVGRGRERDAEKTLAAFEAVAKKAQVQNPETVVVISPHAPLFSDFVFMYDAPVLSGNFEEFGAQDAAFAFEQDSALRGEIERGLRQAGIPGGAMSKQDQERYRIAGSLDHGVLVPLSFYAKGAPKFKVVALSSSGLDPQSLYAVGKIIEESARRLRRKTVVIASGDMSHRVNDKSPYGAAPQGALFDRAVCAAIEKNDLASLLSIGAPLRDKAGECGYRSLVMLCGAFDRQQLNCKLLSYEAPFGIGYCAAEFMPQGSKTDTELNEPPFKAVPRDDENPYISIARAALEAFVTEKTLPAPESVRAAHNQDLFEKEAGVFVSLKKFGELRGCIGTTGPTKDCIAREIADNAVSAGTQDPRFNPVRADELCYIEYSVDVLSKPESAQKAELDPKRYGVIVRSGGRSGLLLPDLDGVDTVETQLSIACRKAGIDPEEPHELYKFTVTRYKAPDRAAGK